MCDDVVIPTISEWIGKKFNNPNQRGLTLELAKNDSIRILTQCFNYLYLKQPRAKLFLNAAKMRNNCTDLYTEKERHEWHGYCEELKKYNERGTTKFIDNSPRKHKFHWAWVVGLIDGDGSIIISKWTRKDKTTIEKPTMQLSLTNHKTIEYLAEILEIDSRNGKDKRPNRKQPKRIRLMSNNIIRILPHIIPYLTMKKELAILALDICTLRREIPNGQYNHENVTIVKEKIEEMKRLNHNKYIH